MSERLKYLVPILLLLYSLNLFSQNESIEDVNNLNGIWIAEDYYKSFEKTKSAIKSRDSFNSSIPVGLRINSIEIKNNILNVGCSYLHNHGVHPEVSKFTIIEGDTVYEQYYFEIDISEKDSLNNFIAKGVFYHALDFTVSLKWTFNPDTVLILHNPNVGNYPGKMIYFKRISTSFEDAYQFPNPLYYYLRSRTLLGSFILKDNLDNVLSKEFSISLNGTAKGFSFFDDKVFHFSTDIYCGPSVNNDYISIRDKNGNHVIGYIIEIYDKTIYFYKPKWVFDGKSEKRIKDALVYKLDRIVNP